MIRRGGFGEGERVYKCEYSMYHIWLHTCPVDWVGRKSSPGQTTFTRMLISPHNFSYCLFKGPPEYIFIIARQSSLYHARIFFRVCLLTSPIRLVTSSPMMEAEIGVGLPAPTKPVTYRTEHHSSQGNITQRKCPICHEQEKTKPPKERKEMDPKK